MIVKYTEYIGSMDATTYSLEIQETYWLKTFTY